MTAMLRQMTVDDLPSVMKIERETFPADAWSEGMLRGELGDQPRTRHYVVALVDDEIVGYAGLSRRGTRRTCRPSPSWPRSSGPGSAAPC